MYSIIVREYGSDHEVELARVSSNPEKIVEALRGRRLKLYAAGDGRKKSSICRYDSIRVVEVVS
jgi:hypothetical protein